MGGGTQELAVVWVVGDLEGGRGGADSERGMTYGFISKSDVKKSTINTWMVDLNVI